jgi:NAD(P)-dependent dehydrogenase (short-subunit alcohol dehydrogenase family)
MEITDRLFIVAGAASGMGLATAEMLAKLGARLALIDIQQTTLEAQAKRLKAYPIVVDTASTELENSFKQIKQHFKQCPSGLINCVGIAPAEKIVSKTNEPASLKLFQQVLQVNLVSAFNLMRLSAAAMMDQEPNVEGERGVMIHTASIAAFEGQMGQVAYSASKSGIVGMILPAARELAAQGIRVNAIAPGLIETPMLKGLPEKVTHLLQAQLPFPKRFGRPEEFANLVRHIIENPLINGTTLRLDGALRMN